MHLMKIKRKSKHFSQLIFDILCEKFGTKEQHVAEMIIFIDCADDSSCDSDDATSSNQSSMPSSFVHDYDYSFGLAIDTDPTTLLSSTTPGDIEKT